jgi:hypothetical protein
MKESTDAIAIKSGWKISPTALKSEFSARIGVRVCIVLPFGPVGRYEINAVATKGVTTAEASSGVAQPSNNPVFGHCLFGVDRATGDKSTR